MSKPVSSLAALCLCCVAAAPAWALATVTFVSGKGVDSGACASPISPCRTFQYALGQTNAGGEIKALDPADYAPVTIDKSISITGVKGAGVIRSADGSAITILAGATDVISLTDLTIDGLGQSAWYGVAHIRAAQLTIRKCMVRNYGTGIAIGATTFLIEDTVVTNTTSAVHVAPNGGAAKGALRRVSLTNNFDGFSIVGAVEASFVDSVAANNSGFGLITSRGSATGGEFLIAHSTVVGNGVGVSIVSGSSGKSAGDNFIRGNGPSPNYDVFGTLTNVGTQ